MTESKTAHCGLRRKIMVAAGRSYSALLPFSAFFGLFWLQYKQTILYVRSIRQDAIHPGYNGL